MICIRTFTVLTIVLLKFVRGQTLFSIEGDAFTGSWDTTVGGTNIVTITFDEQGESESEFNVDISDCSSSDFSVTAGGGSHSSSADIAVTFTNQNVIESATACLDVSLYVGGISIPVATRQIEYAVTSSQSGSEGSVEVQVTQSNLDGVASNSQAAQSNVATGGNTLTFTPTIVGNTLIKYGDTFDVEINAIPSYDVDVSAISVGVITDQKNGVGYVSAPTKKSITIKLPLSSFVDANAGSEIIDLTVNWKLSGTRRQLRGGTESATEDKKLFANVLSGNDPFLQGTTNSQLKIQLIPLQGISVMPGNYDDRVEKSSGSIARIFFGATTATAACLGALVI